MKILIGSAALSQYVDLGRNAKDYDYLYNGEEKQVAYDNKPVEVFTHPLIEEYFGDEERVATLNELYTIKMSHLFWELKNKSWEKHVHDIIKMEEAGAKLIEDLYKILYKVWEERYGKKKANLNMMPEDFFNKNVERIYDHDSIHHSIAYYDRPMFEKILKDNHPVAVDMQKWENLSLADKFKTVREEVFATALERQLIPSNYTTSPRAAYQWALKKTITSFSKGWFPLFIGTHLSELWKPDVNFVERHKQNSNRLIRLGA